MAEGITEYYAHTLLARYGIIGPDRFYEDIAGWRKEMAFAPDSAKNKSLEQLSIDESDFNLDEATLFYTRGPLVALMLDIEIRRQTNNKKSLDDVMRALNNDAKHGKTFREKDLIHTVEKYAGIDLTAFYDHYIHGTDSLPVDTYLTMIGMGKKNPDSASVSHTMVQYGSIDTDIVIQSIDSSYPYAKAGVHDGDILKAINGTKIGPDNLMAQIQNSLPEDSGGIVILSIIRDGVTKDIPVTFPRSLNMNKSLTSKPVDPDAPPLAVEIRKGIVGQ
jgi:predicted metalloprotease with PDZ domain